MCSRSFCADSSSPRISEMLLDHFTWRNDSLRNSPQNFQNKCAETCQNPGSQNSLDPTGVCEKRRSSGEDVWEDELAEQSGGGEQFLLLDLQGEGWRKRSDLPRTPLLHDTVEYLTALRRSTLSQSYTM